MDMFKVLPTLRKTLTNPPNPNQTKGAEPMEVIIKGNTKEIVDFLDSLQMKNVTLNPALNVSGNDIFAQPIKLNKKGFLKYAKEVK